MTTNPRQKHKILVVDDHPFMLKVVSQLIVTSGFKDVELAENGADALQKLKTNRVQLLITDLNMKPVDGYDLVREIRMGMTINERDLPVLVMTSNTEAELVTRCLMLDINGFITKPVEQNELTKKIISALTRNIRLKRMAEYRQVTSQWNNFTSRKDAASYNQTLQSMENAHQFLTTSIPVNEKNLVRVPLPLSLLSAGMALAANVLLKNQAPLLKEGLILTSTTLTALHDNKANLLSGIVEVHMDVNRFKQITDIGNNNA